MKKLLSLNETIEKIKSGKMLVLAADEQILDQLPKGEWIAGTIPYFMGDEGGVFTKDKIFVDEVPSFVKKISIKFYDEKNISNIAADEFGHGYTMLIIPAFSALHTSFAENSHGYEDIFLRPLVGWISGIDLTELGKRTPKVYSGLHQEKSDVKAVAMHIELPENKIPNLDIINLFEQGKGDVITFDTNGFSVSDCFVNGEKKNFADYISEKKIDTKLPLVANYCGALINTSFQSIDESKKIVNFYAPVFEKIEYRVAAPISDYVQQFSAVASALNIEPVFTCNCILNYLYAELDGKKTAGMTGPMTFGEIAFQLLNQTLVYLTINDA